MKNSQTLMLVGGILVLLTGLLLLIAGGIGFAIGGILGTLVGITAVGIGIAQVITGIVIIVSSVKFGRRGKRWAIVALFASLIALLSGGGFFIGALIALTGSLAGMLEGRKKKKS